MIDGPDITLRVMKEGNYSIGRSSSIIIPELVEVIIFLDQRIEYLENIINRRGMRDGKK